MSNLDIFSMALRNLFKRKTRTFLTILGVVIGTAAIVIMLSLGLAMNKTFEEELGKLGDITVITVYPPYDRGGGMYMSMGGGGMAMSASSGSSGSAPKQLYLDANAVESFKRIPGVVAATPLLQLNLLFSAGKYASPGMTVYGIDVAAMEPLGFVTTEGRLLNETDRKNVLFGAKAAYQFMDPRKNEWGGDESKPPKINPMEVRNLKVTYDWNYYSQMAGYETDDKAIPGKVYSIKNVGVLESKDYRNDYSVFMDINQVRQLRDEQERWSQAQSAQYGYNQGTRDREKNKNYDTVLVKCSSLETVTEVKAVLDKIGYPCDMPSQSLESMKNIANSLQSLLATIGAVSLLVATLGITNTMVTAIYERTREIGIMKVIGASLKDIRKLFLTEAALIGFLGGVFGVIMSVTVSHFINTSGVQLLSSIREFSMQTTVSLITPELCGYAILFSTIMGIVAGYFPASRAMKLSALSAIRTE